MKKITGTETEKNLLKAFAGESQARNRYMFFASKAKKDGYIYIQKIFEETASHEQSHAKNFFKFLHGSHLEITSSYPAGSISSTLNNLIHSAEEEKHEHSVLYPEYAEMAEKEGFPEVAALFRSVSKAETYHEKRFRYFIEQLNNDTFFKRPSTVLWKCSKCGYIYEGTCPPEICPACSHPKAYFEEVFEDYLKE